MNVPFKKMNGLGNDFVVLDARDKAIPMFGPMSEPMSGPMSGAIAAAIADRTAGVGCDQVIIMEKADAPADVFMRIYNQDGGEVAACGNATRCIAQVLMDEGGRDDIIVETRAGLLACTRTGGIVTVDMGMPKFGWQEIPLAERMDTRLLDIRIGPIDAPVLIGPSAVNVGNPHCIFFVEDAARYDLEKFGPLIENHPLFPEQANVSLAEITAPGAIRLRVWERGVGLTKACGTAACAVVPAAVRKGLSPRKAIVTLNGGPLEIEWAEHNDHIYMTGPTALDYEGVLPQALFERRS